MNVYVILLRRMGRQTAPAEPVRLEPDLVSSAAKSSGIQILDIITCAGIFDAVLVCRAPDNPTVARLLDALEGWAYGCTAGNFTRKVRIGIRRRYGFNLE